MGQGTWFRVFAASEIMPQPADLQIELRRAGYDLPLHVIGDELGWTTIDIPLDPPLRLERYLTEEDDLRDELNAWAALAETWGADGDLLTRLISTRQLFTLHCPPEMESVGMLLIPFLAARLDGLYQTDGHGFLTADGSLLLAESSDRVD